MTVAGQDRAGDDHFLDLVGTLEDAVSLDVAETLLNAAFLHVALAAHQLHGVGADFLWVANILAIAASLEKGRPLLCRSLAWITS